MEHAQLARHRQALIQTLNCVSDNCPILLITSIFMAG